MGAMMGVAAGLAAGLVGAGVWAAVAYYANVEIGYLAWGIGLLVGIAVAKGAGTRSPALGLTAVVITALSICGGKLLVIDILLDRELAQAAAEADELAPSDFDDDAMVARAANQLIASREAAGDTIVWPDIDYESMSAEEIEALPVANQYPRDVWQEAESEWSSLSEDQQSEQREQASEEVKGAAIAFGQAMKGAVLWDAFKGSFGVIDLLFFGLGVFTAWGIASSGEDEGEPTQTTAVA